MSPFGLWLRAWSDGWTFALGLFEAALDPSPARSATVTDTREEHAIRARRARRQERRP